jgi:hypothetical protein
MAIDSIKKLQSLIDMYNEDPGVFTSREVAQVAQMAQQVGIPFQPKSSAKRKFGVFAQEALDTALLGAIPDRFKTVPLTKGEGYAGMAGDIAGIATPGGAPSLLGRAASKAAGRGVAKLAQLTTKGTGVAPTAAEISTSGLKALRGVQDVGKYGAVRLQQGTKIAADNLRKFGLENQAVAFTKFMNKQAKGLRGFKGFGRGQQYVERLTGEPMFQQAIVGGARFGTQAAAGDLTENLAGGQFDQIITDFMGGASIGSIGGFLSKMPTKNKLFNIRNITAGIVAWSAGQGLPADEDRIYARLLTLAGLATGARGVPKLQ